MGPNDIFLAESYAEGTYDFGLVMNRIVNHGLCTTYSADNEVTDSAASGTALSTGIKTNNGTIGKDANGQDIRVMLETAKSAGKKVGIVTDDYITGATPSAFMTHCENRKNEEELINNILSFPPDVLIGRYNADHHAKAVKKGYLTAIDVSLFAKTLNEAQTLPKVFVGFNGGSKQVPDNELAYSAQTALKLLENENGFFLMIEGCGQDKYGHDNIMNGKINSVSNLDRTVAAVLLYMQEHPDTLLIITSDHETGGVQLPAEGITPTDALFTTTSHTGNPVRVFAVGQGSEYFRDTTVDNTDVAKFIIAALTK
jgi:alkaline phosphatase